MMLPGFGSRMSNNYLIGAGSRVSTFTCLFVGRPILQILRCGGPYITIFFYVGRALHNDSLRGKANTTDSSMWGPLQKDFFPQGNQYYRFFAREAQNRMILFCGKATTIEYLSRGANALRCKIRGGQRMQIFQLERSILQSLCVGRPLHNDCLCGEILITARM